MANNIKCPRCGRYTPDGTYCENCGKALHSCPACGAGIARNAVFCPECGAPISRDQREANATQRSSWAWWLLPLLLSWIGGVIAWALLRYRDRAKARNLLWFGISLTIIVVTVQLVLAYK